MQSRAPWAKPGGVISFLSARVPPPYSLRPISIAIRSFLALAAAAVLAAVPASPTRAAHEIPGAGLGFVVHRGDSPIGTHRISFARSGDELAVETITDIAVRIAFITVYRYSQTVRQTWRTGRLQSLDARTDDNGEVRTLRVRPGPDGLVVDGPSGRRVVALDIHPTGYWNRDIVGRTQLLDVGDGDILTIAAQPAGARTLKLDDRLVEAQLYRFTGDITAEAGYSPEGEWVSLLLITRGNEIKYVREPAVPLRNAR